MILDTFGLFYVGNEMYMLLSPWKNVAFVGCICTVFISNDTIGGPTLLYDMASNTEVISAGVDTFTMIG